MDAPLTIGLIDDPATPLPPQRKQAIREHAFLMLWLLLGLLAIFVMLVAFARSRRNARLRAMKADTAKRRAQVDPWRESANRVEAPDPEQLERDRLDLDDTDMQGSDPPRDPPDPR